MNPQGGVQTGLNKHDRRPPRSNERERKVKADSSTLAQLRRVFHGLTEGCDFAEGLYDALPCSAKKRHPKPKGKSGCLHKGEVAFKEWDKIDIPTAIWNVIKNHYADKLVGYTNRQIQSGLNRGTFPDGTPLPSSWWGPVTKGGGFGRVQDLERKSREMKECK